MSDYYETDGFANYMRDDEFLYDLVEKYCQLFECLEVADQLDKLKTIFGMARGSAQRGVENGVPYSTNRNSVCIHIKHLCESIYDNRRLAKHPEAHRLQRYLPQHLTSDDNLMERITGYTPLREMRETFAVKIMHPCNVDDTLERRHIIFLPIPDGLTASDAANDWKLLQLVCREARR